MTGASAVSRRSSALVERLAAHGGRVDGIDRPILDHLSRLVTDYPETPVETYTTVIDGIPRHIRLKLEGLSPWRSIKGRTAIGLVASAFGQAPQPRHMIESTSGNLGVALGALSTSCGFAFTAVVDERLPAAMRGRIAGARVRVVSADPDPDLSDLHRRIGTAQRLQKQDPDSIWLDQYENPANPAVHELWTAPEIFRQAPGTQAMFIAASTGGTLAGIARAIRLSQVKRQVIGVDVEGSRALVEGEGPRVLTGIGASRRSSHADVGACDGVEIVDSWEGVDVCRAFAAVSARRLGGSSGVVLAACLRVLARRPDLRDVLCVCPDLGNNYEETIYDDRWVTATRPNGVRGKSDSRLAVRDLKRDEGTPG